ncbi:hypothetical protein ABPG77_009835 [Micractinium sp. CCAP 211/92]
MLPLPLAALGRELDARLRGSDDNTAAVLYSESRLIICPGIVRCPGAKHKPQPAMPPLFLAVAAGPVVIHASLSSPSTRCARPRALPRLWDARQWMSAPRCAAASSDDRGMLEAGPPTAHCGSRGRQLTDTLDSSGGGSLTSNPRAATLSRQGRKLSAPPGLEAQLAQLAEQYGCSRAALSQAVAALGTSYQAWFAEHSGDVAAWLSKQGVDEAQLGRLLLRCPVLFTWPVEQRAGMLFGQLQRLGLTVAEAACCFERQPFAAGTPSFKPATGVLAELFAAGSKSSVPAEQLVGSFLRRQPAAITLLIYGAEVLQERIESLLQLGLSKAQLVVAAKGAWRLLSMPPARLAALAGVLQQELGGGRALLPKLLRFAPRVVSCSLETVRARAQALVQVFRQQATLDMVGTKPGLLTVDSSVWQTALAVMQLCGLTEKQAMGVARNNADVLRCNWLAAGPLSNRLALERCMQLTAGQVYERHTGYLAGRSTKRLAGRLLFLQHHGLLLVGLRDICVLNDAQFASLPPVQAAGGLPALQAFLEGLESNPAWRELQAAAVAEQARLQALLPPDLRQAAARRQQAAEHSKEGE